MGLLLNEAGDMVTNDTENDEVLNAFFASVFTEARAAFTNPRPLRPEGKFGAKKTHTWQRRTRSMSTLTNWMCINPLGLTGCIHEC